jgi:hypothetical protein
MGDSSRVAARAARRPEDLGPTRFERSETMVGTGRFELPISCSAVGADAREKDPGLQGNTGTNAVLKASRAQDALHRQRGVPDRVSPIGARWLDAKNIPTLDDDFPPLSDAEVHDQGRNHEEAAFGIDNISEGAALDFHFPSLGDGGVG